jgi:cell division septal protein FtsQ
MPADSRTGVDWGLGLTLGVCAIQSATAAACSWSVMNRGVRVAPKGGFRPVHTRNPILFIPVMEDGRMFFKRGKKTKGKRRSSRRRAPPARPSILEVKMRRGGNRWGWRKAAAITIILLAFGTALIGICMTFHAIGGMLFWNNRFFTLCDIEVEGCGVEVSQSDILGFLPLRVGDNLFAAGLSDARQTLLTKIPKLKDVGLSRRLPGRLLVRVREREAIANLKMNGYSMAVDSDGRVMGMTGVKRRLPLITEHGVVLARPGTDINDLRVMQALAVLGTCRKMQIERGVNNINIRRVDLGTSKELNLLLDDQSEVRWSWRAMEDVYSDVSLLNLEKKLSQLADIKHQGRVFNVLDMTLDNNFPAR